VLLIVGAPFLYNFFVFASRTLFGWALASDCWFSWSSGKGNTLYMAERSKDKRTSVNTVRDQNFSFAAHPIPLFLIGHNLLILKQ
jgi:hypothetical protein